jgi:hypothetical protein
MNAKQRIATREASYPTIWPQAGVAAIEFRCAAALMKRKITPNGLGIRGMSA